MERKTNIQVSISTRDALIEMGRKGDSYDDIIKKLLEFYTEHQ